MIIISAVLVFLIIIVLHEFGHFIVAKLCGIRVNEFAVGMGPAILKKKGKETLYSIRLFPIGGYCSMEGEDNDSDDPRAFGKKSVWRRMAVVVAGACMNLLLGFLILIIATVLYGRIVTTTIADFTYQENDTTGEQMYTSTSMTTGLQKGDTILSVDGMPIWTDMDLSYKVQNSASDTMTVVVRRNGEKVTLTDVTFQNTQDGGRLDFIVHSEKCSFLNVIQYSFWSTLSTGRLIWISLGDLITGKYGFSELSGPVGIVSTIGKVAAQEKNLLMKVQTLLSIASFITINVGIFNLLPLPALDGGRLIFLLVEAIRRKPLKPEHEGMVHFIGFALLMLMMIAVTYQDIVRLFQGS